MRIQKLAAICLFTLASAGVFAQGFEGSIFFTKSNMMDVTQYAYHVKGDKVRIDEMVEGSDKLVATLIVDLKSGDMYALSHERNLWMKRPNKDGEAKVSGAEVKKGSLERSIHGKDCSQYRVKNKEANREVMYWVTEGDYAFFPKLLEILKRKDNFSSYYMAIDGLENKLPLMAEENTLLREKKGFLQVDRIEEKDLASVMFDIPESYEKVER